MPHPFDDLVSRGAIAQGDTIFYNPNGDVRGVVSAPAASVTHVNAREIEVQAFAPDPDRLVQTALPTGTDAAKAITLDKSIMAGSRCHAAGASIIFVPAEEQVLSVGGELVFRKRRTRLELIDPLPFAVVNAGDNAPTVALPIHDAEVDIYNRPAMAIRVKLSRAEQREYAEGQLAATAMAAISTGLARAADYVLLNTIVDAASAGFTIGKAAAAGLRLQEVQAIIGTNGSGAIVSADGGLVVDYAAGGYSGGANGIRAELTDTIATTVIGAFARSAVAIHEEIRLVAERANLRGDLNLTVFATIQPLLPNPACFWKWGA